MTSLITERLRCNLPWNTLKFDDFKDCETEEHFRKYLQEVIEQQESIYGIAEKCRAKVWSMTHWGGSSIDANTSSIIIDLMVTEGQVVTTSYDNNYVGDVIIEGTF